MRRAEFREPSGDEFDGDRARGYRRTTPCGTSWRMVPHQEFLSAVNLLPGLWSSVDIRTVAIHFEGTYLALRSAVTLRLSGAPRAESTKGLPATGTIRVFRSTRPIAALGEILGEVESGTLRVDSTVIRLVGGASLDRDRKLTLHSFGEPQLQTSTAVSLQGVAGSPRNAHRLLYQGSTTGAYLLQHFSVGLSAVDRELRSLPRPWDGLSQLIRVSGAAPGGWLPDTNLSCEVIAPLGVQLVRQKCVLMPRRIHVSVIAETKRACQLARVRLSGESVYGSGFTQHLETKRDEWKTSGGKFYLDRSFAIGNAETATVFLQQKTTTVQHLELKLTPADRSPLFVLHANSEKHHGEWVRRLTKVKDSEAWEFELASAQLLSMLGLSIEVPEQQKPKDRVDLVAAIEGYVFTVECTTGTLKGDGKLARLVRRASETRMVLRSNGLFVSDQYLAPTPPHFQVYLRIQEPRPLCVVPVMFCSHPSTSLSPSEARDAHQDGVAVIAREDIVSLLSSAEFDQDPRTTWSGLVRTRLSYALR